MRCMVVSMFMALLGFGMMFASFHMCGMKYVVLE